MLKEALLFLKNEFKGTEFHEINGETYTNDNELRVLNQPRRSGLIVSSLTGLVDFLKDNFDKDSRLVVIVKDEEHITVETELDNNQNRETVISALADIPEKTLNSYMNLERFNIQMQSQFVPNDDSAKVLQIVGNIRSENVKTVGDDGTSQAVEVRQGLSLKENANVPNPVYLKPFRTFTEIAQPESPFVFRLKARHDEVEAALYEADGGAWRNEARINIKEYLAEELKEMVVDGHLLIIG